MIIKARLLVGDKPVAGANLLVGLCTEKEGQNTTCRKSMSFDEYGQVEPEGTTDSEGNVQIVADRRYWEKSGVFTLFHGLGGQLQTNEGIPLVIKVAKGRKSIDLGVIRVRKE